jgi:two-component SAPR family response regulator
MPVLDGIEFIKSLDAPPLMIMTTAYNEFALETYDIDKTDYLVKPIEFPRFMKAINKVDKRLNSINGKTYYRNNRNDRCFLSNVMRKNRRIFL